ncbi:MAG: nitrite reductase small subunit NirD [Deltaproteobacteria bacterium]|nr:nitrite reductase small subunit NirD [Deltaproteobacteria bacterium]
MPKQWEKIANVDELIQGKGKAFTIKGKNIAVFWLEEAYYGIENACYHQGAPIDDGDVKDCIVTCPAHSWKFDLKTGECTRDDSIVMKTYPVKVEAGDVKILI